MTLAPSVEFDRPAAVEVPAALAFRNISKRFRMHHERPRSFQELWVRLAHGRLRTSREEFWALRDLSFEVRPGEMVAIIGANGSGKSTLLRLAARTMRPSVGTIEIRGRVAPLLDLAAGFHPDLSGEENIYLNGGLLGLSRQAIADRYSDVVAFSELEQFIDTPIKHYSTGMWLRLGFSIAAHADADILLIDEGLAVGDAHFQKKCLERIDAIKQRGVAILLVSHALQQVAETADRAVWIEGGRMRAVGSASEIVDQYKLAAEG